MSPTWRWIIAMGGGAFVAVAGLLVLLSAGESTFRPFGWLILAVGVLSMVINYVMRDRFIQR